MFHSSCLTFKLHEESLRILKATEESLKNALGVGDFFLQGVGFNFALHSSKCLLGFVYFCLLLNKKHIKKFCQLSSQ
jgi:hypothetical protein